VAERGLRRALWLLGACVVALALWLALPFGLRHLEFFRVRRVEIVGLQYLDAAKVIAAAKLAPRASVFDDHEPLAARLRALPGVAGAEVGSRAPGTLRIELAEAEPVALAPKGDRLAMVNERAEILPFDPLGSAPDLPVLIGGGEVVAGALARAKELDPGLFAQPLRNAGDGVEEAEAHRFSALGMMAGRTSDDEGSVRIAAPPDFVLRRPAAMPCT